MQKKILICDDDTSILEVIKIILEQNNYLVETITTGKGIQKKIKERRPDLLLVDLWMPGMDGQEITKLLKKDPETKDIPIIIISALNDTEKVSKKVGADSFLPKPFNMEDLLNKVNKLIV